MKKLPEYFAIKRKKKDPRWKQYIAYLNGRFGVSLNGTSQTYPYYGYGGSSFQTDMHQANPAGFPNPVTVLTLDEFFDIINGTESSKLPEKWCLKITSANHRMIGNWRTRGELSVNTGYIISPGWHNNEYVKGFWKSDFPAGYTEITTEQFEKLVLELEPTPLPTHWVIRPTNKTESAAVLTWFNANGERKYEPGGESNYYWHFPAYEPTNHCLMSRIHNNNYTQITFAEFQEYVLKENPNKTQPMSKTYQVKKSQLKEIHDVACDAWKAKIENMTLRDAFIDSIQVTQDEIDEMFAAATASQRPVLESIFGKPKPQIDYNRIRTGSRVMIKHTGRICTGIKAIDLTQPVDVVFYKTPHCIDGNGDFKNKSYHAAYCTFHQKGQFVLFGADNDIDYIAEVIEY